MSTYRKVFVLAVTMFAAAGCAHDEGPTDPTPLPVEDRRPFQAAELSVASSSNDFGVGLFRRIAKADAEPNLMISPLSASMALGMTMNGAEGATLDGMRSTLGFGSLDEGAVNEAYRGLLAQLRARGGKVEFRLANAIWYRQGFDVKQPFLDVARTSFSARVSALDFSRADAPRTISKWAEDETGGRIKDLVENIDPLDMMFLVNAVYFKAPWAKPFEPTSTRPAAFTRASGGTVNVATMSQTGVMPYVATSEVQAVELPYADTAFSMVLLAPAGNASLTQLLDGITAAKWSSWMSALRPSHIMLAMPKFKFEYDVTMNDALKALGMAAAFDPTLADFDRIPTQGHDDLYISKVRQKAYIDVHELGTEAAAATSVTASVTSLPPQVRFDRPFVFAIRERSSGTILFVGRVGDPVY